MSVCCACVTIYYVGVELAGGRTGRPRSRAERYIENLSGRKIRSSGLVGLCYGARFGSAHRTVWSITAITLPKRSTDAPIGGKYG